MHVLLTGASGYLGARVAARLVERGHAVTGLVRRPGSAPPGVAEAVGGLGDHALLAGRARATDAVIHTAFDHGAEFADAVAEERGAVDVMLAAARGTGQPVVLTSAVGVLGPTGPHPAPEDAPVSAEFPARIRGHLEERVRAGSDGVAVSALRLPVLVHGDAGSAFLPVLMAAARRDGVSRYPGDGSDRLSAVHADDAADAYVLALEHGAGGRVWNVAAETVTARALAEAVAEGAGGVSTAPATLGAFGAATHPFLALLLSASFELDAGATRRELGWTPRGPGLAEDVGRGSYARAAGAAA